MAQTYSNKFKEEVCKRVQSGLPVAQIAMELYININTLYIWVSCFKKYAIEPFMLAVESTGGC